MTFSRLTASRWSWFVVVGTFFGARDMCAGNGGPPRDPNPPTPPTMDDAGPADAGDDASMTSAPARPTGRILALLRIEESKRLSARARRPA